MNKTILIIILSVSLCMAFENPDTGPVLVFYTVNLAAIVAVSCIVYYTAKSMIKSHHETTPQKSAETTGAGGEK